MRQTTQITQEQASNKGKKWYLVDATGISLGRLASEVAVILMGKNKVDYTPSVDSGDYVVVINAKKVKITGNKALTKNYYDNKRGSYMGLRTRSAKVMQEEYPVEMVRRAIWGMMPHTSLGRKELLKLFIFEDEKHDKEAQKPETIVIADKYLER